MLRSLPKELAKTSLDDDSAVFKVAGNPLVDPIAEKIKAGKRKLIEFMRADDYDRIISESMKK
jgi:hypothetical protein